MRCFNNLLCPSNCCKKMGRSIVILEIAITTSEEHVCHRTVNYNEITQANSVKFNPTLRVDHTL